MGVVSRTYGELDGAGMEVVAGKYAGQSQEGLVVCREMPECDVKTLVTPDLPGAQLWVGWNRNWSVYRGVPYTGHHENAPVHVAGRLHSRVLHGRSAFLASEAVYLSRIHGSLDIFLK